MSHRSKFFKHNARDKLLLLEALAWLCWAKLLLLIIPFRYIAPRLGSKMAETPLSISEAERSTALRISWAVQSVAKHAPFGFVCLPQAMAAKWMLRHRSLATTLYIGVLRAKPGSMTAHAWLRAGDKILTGRLQSIDHQVVATFAEEKLP